MPVGGGHHEYAIVDPDTLETFPCTEEEYENAAPEYREKSFIPDDRD